MSKVLVTGHKSPDTDSYCSALSYAYLKNALGVEAEAIAAGAPNKETQFVLDYFKVTPPRIVKDFYVKVSQVMQAVPAVDAKATVKEVALWYKEHQMNRVPVVNGDQFVGMIVPPRMIDFTLTELAEGTSKTAGDYAVLRDGLAVTPDTPLKDFVGNHCGFSAVVEDGKYLGVVSNRAEYPKEKQEVILVDHNEKVQIIDGIEEAEIIENIDHHRIGGLTTEKPIFIHYEPVGCTCTIVAGLFKLHDVEIPVQIAGLLLSAIISDTVLFRSPTCTEKDKATAMELAAIAGVNLEEYGLSMLKAGAGVDDLTPEEIVHTDMKEFSAAGKVITIAQISVMDTEDVLSRIDAIYEALEGLRASKDYEASYLMITNILEESTRLLFAGNVEATVEAAFKAAPADHMVYLANTMSRKKQIVPPILGAMK